MRVLILTSSTGGGHDMRARAFQAWAQRERSLQLEAQLHRPLESSHGLYRFGVSLYNWIQHTAPFLHHVYFNFLEVAAVVRTSEPFGKERFREALETVRPDVVMSVHDSLNHTFFKFARDVLGKDRVRCVICCDELHGGYGFSRHWVNPEADLFIGAVAETCEAAIRGGMPREKTVVGGFLLKPLFYNAPDDEQARHDFIRNELEFDPEQFILVLSASSRGANNHIAFLETLKQHNVNVQIAALPGKSAQSRERVAAWAKRNAAMHVKVLAHNSDVGALMRSASAIVARPGTGTTCEAILSGCPLLLNGLGGMMPQERITVKFCSKHGIAETLRRPEDLARYVSHWAKQPDVPRSMKLRMEAARPKAHPRDILRSVAAL